MAGGSGKRGSVVSPPTIGDITIYIAQEPVDFRLGINGLSVVVEATLRFDPFSRNLFCFTNKRKNQIKVLYWQRSGFCLWQKRLEEERFKWPVHLAPLARETDFERASGTARPPVVTLNEEQFLWLLEGLDLKHLKPHRSLEYRSVL
jgi:transposase